MRSLLLGALLVLALSTSLAGQELALRDLGRVGALDGPPEQLIFRVFDAAIDHSGVWIAHGGDQQLKRYDLHGGFVGVLGGPGEGPGEFQGLTHVETDSAGRIFAIDRSRVIVFDSGGAVLKTMPLELPEYSSALDLVRGEPLELIVSKAGDPRYSRNLFRDSLQIVRKVGADWVPLSSAVPSMWWGVSQRDRGVVTKAFADGPRAIVGAGEFIVVAREDAPVVDILVGRESWSWESPTTRSVRSSEVEGERFFEAAAVGDSRFVIGESSLRDGVRRWWVVDQTGTTVGWFNLSADTLVLDVRGRTLIVRTVGEFDVEYLRILELAR